ncbi:MAG TPA: DUF2510 domain-containing protein [Galbitalea sp.]
MTNGTPQGAPSPDWYLDPSTPGQLRFWDGAVWTDHTKPVPTPTAPGMPAPMVAQPDYSQPAQTAQYVVPPTPRKLANRAAGFGMLGVLLAAIGIVVTIFAGSTPLTVALILGGAIVFVICLVFCIVFTIQRR